MAWKLGCPFLNLFWSVIKNVIEINFNSLILSQIWCSCDGASLIWNYFLDQLDATIVWFIDKPITQHVSGTIVPIFRSARLYTTAYGFQHLKVPTGVLGHREAGRVHSAECSSLQSCTPEDGHNVARNMLNYWFINKSQLLHQFGLTNHLILSHFSRCRSRIIFKKLLFGKFVSRPKCRGQRYFR